MKRVEVVLASAGSGKTFTLTLRFAGLLLRGARPEDVLAATFTRKAAGEIQARILERLAGAAEGGKGLDELRKHLDWPELEVGHCQQVLKRTVDALPRMQVLTLDSWFARLGRGLAPELGLDPGWRMLEEVEDEELRIQALEEVLARGDREERIALLRDLQRGRSEARVLDRLLRSVASAHARARWSVEGAWDHLAPAKPLEAAEFEALYQEFSGLEVVKNAKGEENGNWTNGKARFLRALSDQDWAAITGAGLYKGWVETGTYQSKAFADADPRWEAAFQRLRLHMGGEVLAEVARQNQALSQLLAEFGRAHDQILEREGGLRFDDLTWRLASAALGDRDFDLAYRLDTRLHHVLLDEYQDTNALQHAVLDRNLKELASYGEEDRSLFVVGDPKQSIYGFREAEPRLLQDLGERLSLEPSSLATNWRSSPRVLEFVNRIFSQLASAPFLDPETPALRAAQAFEEGWEEHTPAKPNLDLPGRVRVWEAAKSDGQSDTEELLDVAVRLVAELREEAPHARIAVLTRTGRFGVKLLARLAEEGIPAAGEGGRPLVDSHLVRCTLGLLRLADHPGDGLALALVMGSPLLGLFPELDPSGPLPELGRGLSHLARTGIAEQGIGPWLAGLRDRLEDIAPYDAERFEALLRIAHAWPESPRGRLAPLLAHLQEARTEGASDAQVRVLTIHASKGLEYDAVVLPELGGKMFETPSLVSRRGDAYGPVELLSTYQSRGFQCLDEGLAGLHEWDQKALLTDSLCMLYVALTRAKRSLDLILPHWRPKKGKKGRAALPESARWCHFVRFLGTAYDPDPEGPLLLEEASDDPWFDRIEPREEQPQPAPPPTLALRPGGAFRPLPSRSPSAAEGGQRRTVAAWLRGVDEGAVALGTCVHALLERVEWGDTLDLSRLGDQARAEGLGAASEGAASEGAAVEGPGGGVLERALELLDEALVAPELRSLLVRPEAGAELWRERRFAVELEGELWSGTFDRVVLHRDEEGALTRAEVLDWKTDRVEESGLSERAEHYRPQLEAYGRVLAAMTGLAPERIALRLVFLRAGRVVDL